MRKQEVFAPPRPAPPPRSSRLIGWQEEVDLLFAEGTTITGKKTSPVLLNSLLSEAGYYISLDQTD